jgi:predicted RND superfamily exporter protein
MRAVQNTNDGGYGPGGNDFIERLNDGFAALAGWCFDHRWWVVAFSIGLLGGGTMLAAQAEIDSSYAAFFDADDHTYLFYEQYREDFGSDEISYIVYEAPGFEHGPWNLEVMQRIADLTDALEEVPFVYEVHTLAGAELMIGEEDGIRIRELRDDPAESQEELLELRDLFMAKPVFVGGLISADMQHGAIMIEMDRSSTDPLDEIRWDPEGGDGLENLYPQVTDIAIEEVLARPEYEGIVFTHSGDVPFNAAFNYIISSESLTLGALTAGVIALLLFAFFRSPVGVLAPTFVVQASVLMTVAFIVAVGWKLDMVFSSVPTLVTAIGVAHAVHILSEFRASFRRLGDRREALVHTIYLVGTPCLLTSVTTAAGFLSMSSVEIEAISHQGVYAAFGVMMAFVLSLTLLMALLSFGRRKPRRHVEGLSAEQAKGSPRVRRGLRGVANFVIRRRIAVLTAFGLTFAFSFAGMAQLVADSNWLNDFKKGTSLRDNAVKIESTMGGLTNLVILFDGGEEDAVKDPAFLEEVKRIQTWVDDQFLVAKSYSIVDILQDLNKTFHADDPDWYRLPDSRELIAQYLIMYESAGGTQTDQYLSSDRSTSALELRLRLDNTSETANLLAGLEQELEERPLEQSELRVTGIGALWVKLLDYIVSSQIQGFLTAFCIIAVMMCVLLRSIKTGMIAMVPNLSPILLTLGMMGWLGVMLDYSKIVIAAVALGIAVDDTIHLMFRFRHEFQQRGSYEEALRAALSDVGRALLITSISLVAGFLMLGFSALASNATQGLLLAGTIVTALVADFLLMPALVLTFKPFGPEDVRAAGESVAELSEAA